jgi:hypothetical protein
MTTPAEYRQSAEECLQAARAALLPDVRAVLLTMAQRWNALAERAQCKEHALAPEPIAPQLATADRAIHSRN